MTIASISNAQVEKGNILLGTTVNLTGNALSILSPQGNNVGVSFGKATSKYGDNESESNITIFNFSPQVGYFFADGFVGGVTANFLYYSEKEKDADDKYSTSIFKAGPFLRYYFEMEKIHPYLHAGAAFGNVTNDSSDDDKETILEVGGGVGVAIFLNEQVSFDIIAGYNYFQMKYDIKDNPIDYENTFQNFALDIGFTIMLGAKKGE